MKEAGRSRRNFLRIAPLVPVAFLFSCSRDEQNRPEVLPNEQEQVSDQDLLDAIYTIWDNVNEDFQGRFSRDRIDQKFLGHLKDNAAINTTDYYGNPTNKTVLWDDRSSLLEENPYIRIFLTYSNNNCLLPSKKPPGI